MLRRNLCHLLKTNETPITTLPPYDIENIDTGNEYVADKLTEKINETSTQVEKPAMTSPARLRPRENIFKPARYRDENFV